MNIKKIIREEIQKLEEKVISLSKDEMSILHSKGSIDKDGYTIRFDTELDEGFGREFLSKKERKIFEKERLESAEVLGYELTGTKDIKETTSAVNLDKEKNGERHPKKPNFNYDPEKGKSRIKKIRENKNLITEATRWLVGVEMPNGQITSTYGHWDGYPSYTGKLLKRYYSGGAGKVRDLLKLGKNGISSLEKSMKGGKGHSFEKPLPGESVFYGRDRGDKQRSMRKWRNRDSVKFNSGEEFAYIWSVKDRKWYFKDTDKDEWKVL
jgi:hypothetical protein